jgi:hypothetical protein
MPACNERFCESGGVCPPEQLCKLASSPPAQTFVNPPPSQSRHNVVRHFGDSAVRKKRENLKLEKSEKNCNFAH